MFRKQVLETVYNNEKWQSILQLKSPFNFFFYALLTILILCILTFIFFGTISTKLDAQGIIIGKNSSIFSAVAEDKGQVANLLVKVGDQVKKGQIIAKINRPDLINTIMLVKQQITLLNEEKKKLEAQKTQELNIQNNHAQKQLDTLNKIIGFQKIHTAQLEVSMKEREGLAKKGIISKLMMEEQERLYNEIIKSMNENNAKILEVESNLLNVTHQWNQRLLEIDKAILEKQVALKQVEYTLFLASQVKSPADGVITGISSNVGLYIQQGDEIATISPIINDFDAILFLPASNGQLVKKDMQALVSPAGYPSEEYGSIVGYVTDVQAFPASKKELENLLQNATLAERLLENQKSLIIVRVRLFKSDTHPNQLRWTSSANRNLTIQPGSLCGGQFIVKQRTPFELIIPTFKRMLGVT